LLNIVEQEWLHRQAIQRPKQENTGSLNQPHPINRAPRYNSVGEENWSSRTSTWNIISMPCPPKPERQTHLLIKFVPKIDWLVHSQWQIVSFILDVSNGH
jgi:hypothetical protein